MSLPSIIKGWDIPKEAYRKAHREDGLVKLLIELSNVCNLSCSGCFTKRVEGGWTPTSKKRLPNEIDYETQLRLIEEAAELGVQTVDIVGAGEPTLDPTFYDVVDHVERLGMQAVVFTHGATRAFEDVERWRDKEVSFFVKLWSRNPELQDGYVSGSLPDYSLIRDKTIERMVDVGLTEDGELSFDDIDYRTTRVGADVLVMRSNAGEIGDLLRYCRQRNIMPIIKTYIPEGPTRFDQEMNLKVYQPEELDALRQDEISPEEFQAVREELIRIDREEFGIPQMSTFYPQASKCTQSMASLYVTITGEIKSCVGTHHSYGHYEPGKSMLARAVEERKEKVGFGCVPRLLDAQERGLKIDGALKVLYAEGIIG